MKLKTGRSEIVYLLTKAIEKYESQTGEQVVRNTNRKNYEAVARKLSEISNELPRTAEALRHDTYTQDYNPKNLDYPARKYDLTASQIKDAYSGIVSNPRPFLVDACYIYLYGMGRKGFAENPVDLQLLEEPPTLREEHVRSPDGQQALQSEISVLNARYAALESQATSRHKRRNAAFILIAGVFLLTVAFLLYKWTTTRTQLATIKKDFFILPYQPTKAEVDSLEGIWLSYTGSPQARSSDPNRYHIVISNILEVSYKQGYFTFNRYGASFNHVGYMQFDAPWLVSIHSYAKNSNGSLESPKHSLMLLNGPGQVIPVISASWNFDAGNQNKLIGIREVYIKQGKGGRVEEIINSTENVSCRCKIINWFPAPNSKRTFHLKNELLDTLPDPRLKNLLDEKSILPRLPQEVTIFSADTTHR